MNFRAPADARSLTLTPEQTQAAGAALGSGRHLFFRVKAVRQGDADTRTRKWAYLEQVAVAGMGPTTSGTAMRFGAYNVHVQAGDVSGHTWSDRAQLVADNIADNHPSVVALAELVPGMWTNHDGGPGLDVALGRAGIGSYTLTRDTGYDAVPGDARILYDPNAVTMTSVCDPTKFSCAIKIPQPKSGKHPVAPYAKFQGPRVRPGVLVRRGAPRPRRPTWRTDGLAAAQAQAIADRDGRGRHPEPPGDHRRAT